jgi:hypothetical protein
MLHGAVSYVSALLLAAPAAAPHPIPGTPEPPLKLIGTLGMKDPTLEQLGRDYASGNWTDLQQHTRELTARLGPLLEDDERDHPCLDVRPDGSVAFDHSRNHYRVLFVDPEARDRLIAYLFHQDARPFAPDLPGTPAPRASASAPGIA